MRARNKLLFILTVFIWGLSWSAMKTSLMFVSPLNFSRQTFSFAALALSPILLFNYRRLPRDRKSLGNLLIFSIFNVASTVAMYVGLTNEGSGIASVLVYTQPLFVLVLAVPFLNEKVTSTKVLGGFLGFVGIVFLSLRGLGLLSVESTVLLLLGALLWAAAIVYYKGYMTQIDPLSTNFVQYVISAILVSIVCVCMSDYVFPTNLTYLSTMLYISVVDLVIGWTIWLTLLRSEDATILAGSTFLVPLIALFFGSVLLGERINLQSAFGSALVLLGVYIVNMNKKIS
jgi:drug/metabolite transporter (DMT)-like permease